MTITIAMHTLIFSGFQLNWFFLNPKLVFDPVSGHIKLNKQEPKIFLIHMVGQPDGAGVHSRNIKLAHDDMIFEISGINHLPAVWASYLFLHLCITVDSCSFLINTNIIIN